jgi:HEAT repeat protein
MGPKARGLIPALLVNLQDEDHFVRRGAAWALGQVGSDEDRVVAALIGVLRRDPDSSVRCAAAYALGYIGSPKARAALEQAAGDDVGRVREGARSALQRVR